ncbi:MAG: phosphotransferase family protein [bacterium]
MASELIDRPRQVRKGEELEAAKIETFLKGTIPGLDGPVTILQYPGGHSNLTYSVRVGGHELVLRRPPFGTKAKTAHDMHREYRILKILRPVFPYCPQPLAYTEDPSIMGCPFYVMEKVRGIIVRKDWPAGLELMPDQVRALFTNVIRVHAELHAIDYQAAGLGDFGKPKGYVRRQVEGWIGRYRNARTPDAPDCEEVMGWFMEHMPAESERASVIHNDFRLDNCVLDEKDPLRIIGVLDWEMATIGDPLMDLGSSLAYFIHADDPPEALAMRTCPSNAPGAPTRREVIRMYEELSGMKFQSPEFYYAFGLFRLAVIVQQIYYRFYHGQTQDVRFQAMIFGTIALEKAARRVIEGEGL